MQSIRLIALQAVVLTMWFVVATLQVDVEHIPGRLAPQIGVNAWWSEIAVGPCAVAVIALLLAALTRPSLLSADQRAELRQSSLRLASTILVLLLLRLASLSSLVTAWLPASALLWSPHANWAVALASLLTMGGHLHSCLRPTVRPWHASAWVFAGWVLVYGAWTLYVCQMTIVHGDEGHYLRVTQSLLRDGDIDLANNLAPEDNAEFTPIPFGVDRAPASPAGKVYSLHPPAMSVLVAPAYALGVRWWGNPRLSSALFMALLTAGCVALLYHWLVQIGVGSSVALATSGIVATTAPLFLYSTQIYPDVPALLVILVLLCGFPRIMKQGGLRASAEPRPILHLVAVAGMLAALAFFHPRFLPMCALGGVLLIGRAAGYPRPRQALVVLAVVSLVALSAMIYYNLQMTADWLGYARPGNAWQASRVSIRGVPITLAEHWLHAKQGLLNSSPVFVIALIGLGLLVLRPDRRLLFTAVLYTATVGVNGLTTHLVEGYHPAGRYLIVGVPVISLCFATGLRRLWGRSWGRLLTAFLLAVSWDTVRQAARVPEFVYGGHHLALRNLEAFYPWEAHFSDGYGEVSWADLALWLGLAGGLALLLRQSSMRNLPGLLVGVALVTLPAGWSQSATAGQRLGDPGSWVSRNLRAFTDLADPSQGRPLSHTVRGTTGMLLGDSVAVAHARVDSPGILLHAFMPILPAGRGHFTLRPVTATAGGDTVVGSLLVTQAPGALRSMPWQRRHSVSFGGAAIGPQLDLDFVSAGYQFGVGLLVYSGYGSLTSFVPPRLSFSTESRLEVVEHAAYVLQGGPNLALPIGPISSGRYRVSFNIEGSSLGAWFDYRSRPVELAVYALPPNQQEELQWLAQVWMNSDRVPLTTAGYPRFRRPLVEVIAPVWWLTVPFAGQASYSLDFVLDHAAELVLLAKYSGPESLDIPSVALERLE